MSNILVKNKLKKYHIESICYKLGGKLKTLQKCFPELNITDNDVYPETYTDEDVNSIINIWIQNNNLSISDLLNKGLSYTFDNKMKAMMAVKFYKESKSSIDMIMEYCNKNNIFHPLYNRKIIVWDFEEMPPKFWNNKQNRINRIKYYCEQECKESILTCINNTELLRDWIYNYFRQIHTLEVITLKKGTRPYDILIEAYPEISNDKILFDWEWHQCGNNDKKILNSNVKRFCFISYE